MEDTHPRVTLVMNKGALGDMGYNDLLYSGIRKAVEEFDLDFVMLTPESEEVAEKEILKWSQTSSPGRRLLILAGEDQSDIIRRHNLRSSEGSSILQLDCNDASLGVSTIHLPVYGVFWALGSITGALCEAVPNFGNKAAIVLANPYDSSINEGREAFATAYASHGCQTDVFYLSDKTGDGYDSSQKMFEMCSSLDGNYTFILPLCGGSAAGLYSYMTLQMIPTFASYGVDSDRNTQAGMILASALKRIDNAVYEYCASWFAGDDSARHLSCTMEQGGSSVVLSSAYEPIIEMVCDFESICRQACIEELNYLQ